MRVAVTSGRLGGPVAAGLRAAGHDVVVLVTGPSTAADERTWDPEAGHIDGPGLGDVDAVINLHEASLWRRWRASELDAIRATQITGTLSVVSHLEPEGRCQRFLNLSGASFYGDRGDEVLDGDSTQGRGWIASATAAWEAAARHAPVPTALIRAPMVLGVDGASWQQRRRGPLAGRLGHGRQWRSWIHIDDWVAATLAILDSGLEGPCVLAAPEPVRESAFVAALAAAHGRRTPLPIPEALLRARFGREFTDEVLMASRRIVPRILSEELGFTHRFPHLEAAVADLTRRGG